MKIYAFSYNFCIHESGFSLVSLHKSKKGAIDALAAHKSERKKEWDDFDKWQREEFGKDYKRMRSSKFGKYEKWIVEKVDVLP